MKMIVWVGLLIFTVAAGIGLIVYIRLFDTQYAPQYSERAFNSIRMGDSIERVISLIGPAFTTNVSEPYLEWVYSADKQRRFAEDGEASGTYTTVRFKNGSVTNVTGVTVTRSTLTSYSVDFGDGAGYLKLSKQVVEQLRGASEDQIRARFGPPTAIYEDKSCKTLRYSRSPSGSNYRLRVIGFDRNGKVVHIWRSIYWD